MLADRIGVISVPEFAHAQMLRRWQLIGIDKSRIAATDPLTLENPDDKEELEQKFLMLARKQIREQGAELIVSGCSLYLAALGSRARERLSSELGVPVIDPVAVGVQMTEMMVKLKLSQSKRAYPQ